MAFNPRSRNCVCRSTNQGISVLQPPHQVAQKLSNTTPPLNDERRIGLPAASFKVKSMAGLRSCCASICALAADVSPRLRLSHKAREQSTQRCAKTRGPGDARRNTTSDAVASAILQHATTGLQVDFAPM